MTQLPTLRTSDASINGDAARRPDVKVAPTHSCSFGPGTEPLSAWQSMASSADLERVAQQQRDHQAWVTRARLADHRMPGGVLSAGSAPSLLPPPGPAPIFNLPVGPNPPHVSASVSTSPTSAAPSPIRPRAFATALRPAPRTGPTSATVLGSLQMFVATPHERELNKTSRSGRQLSELEILQEKHEPEFRRLVPVVAEALRDVLAQHEAAARTTQRDERYVAYDTSAVPQIQIDDYVQRIAECTYISPATMLGALVTMDRLLGRHPTLLLSALNIFKIFFVAVRIASKVIDIRTLNNRNFASVGGTSLRHLNEMECRMLCDLQFDLYISPRDILQYASRAFPPAVGVAIPYGANAVAMLGLPPPVSSASASMSFEQPQTSQLPPASGAQQRAATQLPSQQQSQPIAAVARATSAASSSVRR